MTAEGLREESLTDQIELGLDVENFTYGNIRKRNNLIRRIKLTIDEQGVKKATKQQK